METIHNLVRKAEENYLAGTVKLGEHVDWSMHDTIERIYAYLNSKHISGPTDSLKRPKPFFNIVTAAVNIWYRATDIDRKDIRFVPTSKDTVLLAFIANVMLQNWMEKANFGVFLNKWGRTLAQYGGAVRKFVEVGGELMATVVPWSRIIPDPIDFSALPRIEKFYKTPGQLKNMATPGHPDYAGYDKTAVDNITTDTAQSRENLRGEKKDNMSEFIELYEVHGILDSQLLEDEPDEEKEGKEYAQQMHVVCFTQNSKSTTGYNDYTVYKGREKRDVYGLDSLIEEEGRTLPIGAVEILFDSQWMQNHSMKAWKDNMDLASKMVFQTADGNFVGRNVMNAVENGQILIHKENMPLTKVANDEYDLSNVQGFQNAWRMVASELTSTPDAIRGNTMPSGTPYSLAAYQGAQANSLFEIMTENKGLALIEMLKEYVIPHIKKKLKNRDEVVAILDSAGIREIDALYIPKAAVKNFNRKAVEGVINALETGDMSAVPSPYQKDIEESQVMQEMAQYGNKRFFTPDEYGELEWDEVFKDFEWDSLRIEVTNEQADKQATLQTLASLYTATAQVDPVAANVILGKVLTETGVVSPLEVSQLATRPAPTPPMAGAGDINSLVTNQT
jgi:hypothetical protein